jgi:low temperature requirement protein LtrA
MHHTNKPASESAPGTRRPLARPLFEPPRIRTPDEGTRPTTWLELFFDLVFVVAVDQIARRLANDASAHSLMLYVAHYGPVWWGWIGFVIYTDRFGTDDLGDRLFSLAQIAAVLVIAAAMQRAAGERGPVFAVAYGTFRLMLAARYAIAARYVREARRECVRQATGFGIASVIWLASAAVPAPWRFWLWGAGFAVDLLTPFASPRMHAIVPPDPDHVEERVGTFIIISLGEGFVGLVEAMRDRPLGGVVLASAAFTLAIAFSIWWGFFDSLDESPIAVVRTEGRTGPFMIWIFAQLPLAAGIAASGIAAGLLVRDAHLPALADDRRWLICGMMALCYLAHAIAHVAYSRAGGGRRSLHLAARKAPTIAVALLLGALGHGQSSVTVAAILALAAATQVVWSLVDRAQTHPGNGEDPGPGLAGAPRHA